MTTASIIQERATNLALLNAFLAKVEPPSRRCRAILALWESDVISACAATVLLETYGPNSQ